MSLTTPFSNGKIKIPFKKLFFPMLFLLIVTVVFLKFSELKEIGRLFTEAKWYWLVLALCSQVVTLLLQTSVYQKIFHILEVRAFSFSQMARAAVAMTFLNYTIPSLGFAGNIAFIRNMRRRGVSEGTAIMSVIMEFICFYLAFSILVILSFFYLFLTLGHIGYTQKIAAGGFFVVLLLIGGVTYFFLGNKKRARKRVQWLAEKIDMAENGVREEDRIKELLADFYADFDWLKNNKKTIIKPTLIQLARFLSEGVTIFLVFLAFGTLTPIGLGVVAFALGRLFALVSFLPGGIGAFEGAMVLIFNSLNIELELALAVMLLYRFFSYWLYFPLGFVAMRRMEKETGRIAEEK
jgi:glycosyltransferase 2 family protein